MKRSMAFVLLLGIAASSMAQAKPTTRGSLVGTWMKERISVEGGLYAEDKLLDIVVTFEANGRFVWKAARKSPTEKGAVIDESVAGTYAVEGFLITYRFDTPSPAALKRLPEFFAFWPSQLRGQQTFAFKDDKIELGNSGGKTWICLARKKP